MRNIKLKIKNMSFNKQKKKKFNTVLEIYCMEKFKPLVECFKQLEQKEAENIFDELKKIEPILPAIEKVPDSFPLSAQICLKLFGVFNLLVELHDTEQPVEKKHGTTIDTIEELCSKYSFIDDYLEQIAQFYINSVNYCLELGLDEKEIQKFLFEFLSQKTQMSLDFYYYY
jgi:hypothetical protein